MSLAFLLTICMVPAGGDTPTCALSAKSEVETVASAAECTTMAQGIADSVLAEQLELQEPLRSLAVGRCMPQKDLPDVIAGARDFLASQGYTVTVEYY
jgi:hypothetical protein